MLQTSQCVCGTEEDLLPNDNMDCVTTAHQMTVPLQNY